MTQFETLLKQNFPDIARLNELGKWDTKLWSVIYSMMDMVDGTRYGEIKITYQAGKINHCDVTHRISDGATKQNLSEPGL